MICCCSNEAEQLSSVPLCILFACGAVHKSAYECSYVSNSFHKVLEICTCLTRDSSQPVALCILHWCAFIIPCGSSALRFVAEHSRVLCTSTEQVFVFVMCHLADTLIFEHYFVSISFGRFFLSLFILLLFNVEIVLTLKLDQHIEIKR